MKFKLHIAICLTALLLIIAGNANATKWYGAMQTPAPKGQWKAETSTYTWIDVSNNLGTVLETPGGIADWESFHFLTSEFTGTYPFRLCFMNGSNTLATVKFYSASQKDIKLAEHADTKNLDRSQVTHIAFGGGSASGSVKFENFYLYKSPKVTFDNNGEFKASLSDFSVTSAAGTGTFDEKTGAVVVNAEKEMTIALNVGGADFTNVNKIFNDFSTYDYLANTFLFKDNWVSAGAFYSSKVDLNLNDSHKQDGIVRIQYTFKNTTTENVSFTINGVTISADVITGEKQGDQKAISLRSLPYYNIQTNASITPDWLNNGNSTLYGTYSGDVCQYTDLGSYEYIRISQTEKKTVRLFMIPNAKAVKTENLNVDAINGATWNDTENCWLVPIASLPKYDGTKVYLQAIKDAWNSAVGVTTAIDILKTIKESTIKGGGFMTESAKAILNDESISFIDATGLTNTAAIALQTANPNCIIETLEGKLSNEKNVAVGGTIAKLELTDGYTFGMPQGKSFTATAATYSRKMANDFGTIVLPFAVDAAEGASFFGVESVGVESVSDAKLVISELQSVAAGTPAIVKKAAGAEGIAISASGVEVSSAINNTACLKGSFAQDLSVSDANTYYIKENKFWGVNGFFYCDAFRAYLEAPAAAAAKVMDIVVNNPTAVDAVADGVAEIEAIYSADGVKLGALKAGINIVRMTDGKVKTVIVK